jgi:hypothetical protein
MKLNSEFAILEYNGTSAFNLMVPPQDFIEDPNNPGNIIVNPLYVDYNKFIDGIASIYATENVNGIIPTFWTIPSGDSYIASPDVNLTGLQPNNSYYFIARSLSSLPMTIPGAIDENIVVDNRCKRSYGISINGDLSKARGSYTDVGLDPYRVTLSGTNNNSHNLSILLTGLIPYQEYSYSIDSVRRSIDTSLHPYEGSFVAQSQHHLLNSEFYFNPTGTVTEPIIYDIRRLLINPPGDCSGIKQDISFICNNCLPDPTGCDHNNNIEMYINGDDSKTAGRYINNTLNPYQVTLTGVGNNYYNLSVLLSGIIPNLGYTYSISDIGGNWPSVLENNFGTFNSTEDQYIINTEFYFDGDTGDQSIACGSDKTLYKIFNFVLTPDNDCGSSIAHSIRIEGKDCLPACANIPSVSFGTSSILTLPSDCCNISNPITVSISGASPGVLYSYRFSNLLSSSLTLNPATGTIAFGSNGIGRINTLVNPNGNSPSVIKFTLTHPTNNLISSSDFLSVVCSAPAPTLPPTNTPTPTPTPMPTSYDTTIIIPSDQADVSACYTTLAGQVGSSLSFNCQPPNGIMATMYVYVSNVPKASINFYSDSLIGQPCRLVLNGITYDTTFRSGRKDF